MNNFYSEIEETVRPFVKELRDNGINTTYSCEREGIIQATCIDPTFEREMIYNVMYDMGVEEWSAELLVEYSSTWYLSNWEIRSPSFIKKETK